MRGFSTGKLGEPVLNPSYLNLSRAKALGGAMGNLVDRIRYGWVVDFVDFYVRRGGQEHHWPTFNVADIAIVVGVGLMAIDMLRASRELRASSVKEPASAPVPPVA